MLIKFLIFISLILILLALGSSLIFLVSDKGKTNRLIKALTWRIGLSLSLFLFLFFAFIMGWIQPHGIA